MIILADNKLVMMARYALSLCQDVAVSYCSVLLCIDFQVPTDPKINKERLTFIFNDVLEHVGLILTI